MPRRRIALTLILLGSITALISLGTYAWVSNLETSTGNTYTVGTIDLWVDGQQEWTKQYQVARPDGDTFLKPSQIGFIAFPIQNRGNNPTDVWKRIRDTSATENGVTEAEQDYYDTYGGPQNNIDDFMDFDLTISTTDTSPHVIIPETDPLPLPLVAGNWIFLGQLEPGETMMVTQSFHLNATTWTIDPETGLPDTNWAQSDTLNFTEQILGLQITGPTGGPQPQLPGYASPPTNPSCLGAGCH